MLFSEEWLRSYIDPDLTTEELADIPFWTFESLLDELDETAIDPLETMFVPEFYVEWALQRYRMINLLKFAQIDYQCSYLSGSEHTGIPTSPSAAINAALKNAKPGDPAVNGSLSRTTTTIWGPDHGWDYGTYCADVYQCGDVSARLPDELKNAETMLFISVDAPGGAADHFDSYGTGILQGINSFTADEEGKFTSGWTLPATPDKVWTPVEGKTETFGFQALKIFCCADFTGIFKFKEDDAQR